MKTYGPRDSSGKKNRGVYRIDGRPLWALTHGSHPYEPRYFTQAAVDALAKSGKICLPSNWTDPAKDYFVLAFATQGD